MSNVRGGGQILKRVCHTCRHFLKLVHFLGLRHKPFLGPDLAPHSPFVSGYCSCVPHSHFSLDSHSQVALLHLLAASGSSFLRALVLYTGNKLQILLGTLPYCQFHNLSIVVWIHPDFGCGSDSDFLYWDYHHSVFSDVHYSSVHYHRNPSASLTPEIA